MKIVQQIISRLIQFNLDTTRELRYIILHLKHFYIIRFSYYTIMINYISNYVLTPKKPTQNKKE